MASHPHSWWSRSIAAACLVPLLVAAGTPSASAGTADQLHLTFDDTTWGDAGDQPVRSTGTATADIDLLSVNAPEAMFRSGYRGGLSLQLPAYGGTTGTSYAALRVTPVGSDSLSPGTAAFRFGADLQLDASNEGSALDNGNNAVQRGLWDDPMQYKLEVDDNRPNCVFRGTEGRVSVRSRVTLEAEKWYSVECRRSAGTVSISVLARGSSAAPAVSTNAGPLGTLKAPAGTPLSVGAKLAHDGTILRSATDQFNGRVDNVFYQD